MMPFRLLEVNLSTGGKKVTEVSGDFRKYLGGRGYGSKLLWDRVPQGADPLSEENILYFGVGPITGFLGALTNVSAKSPLTFLRGQSNLNGRFGIELIYAGYNAGLLLLGKSPEPVYLYIKNGDVEIRSARHLWGEQNLKAQQMLHEELREDLDDQNFRIVTIGPAGENRVRNATISTEFYHHAARLGMGAVMGSKNLKAVAVHGTTAPQYHDPGKIFEFVTRFFDGARELKFRDRRWGHTSSIIERYYKTTEGIKNKQLGWDPICDLHNPLILEQQYKMWNDSCNLCPVGCKVPYYCMTPPLGPCAGEFRHDNAGGWSANAMVKGYEEQLYVTPYVDDLGIDGEDVSGVVAWMMECYQRGIVSRDELDGVDLTWGNVPAICAMLRKIAYRQGIGDLLAEGLKLASDRLGRGSEQYAIHSKGVAITSYEPRGDMQDALELATGPVGALHAGRGNPERILCDSLAFCTFLRSAIKSVFGSIENYAREMLNAVCGWKVSADEWKDITRRVTFLERCYSLRDGYLPARDDLLPDRFFTEPIHNKYGKPKALDREKFMDLRRQLYLSYELDANGIPPKELLRKIGMDFVIPVLESILPRDQVTGNKQPVH
jgi:aldehyde:ferredoxin oxidoreductase